MTVWYILFTRGPNRKRKRIVGVRIRSQRPSGSEDDTATHEVKLIDTEGDFLSPVNYWHVVWDDDTHPYGRWIGWRFDGYWTWDRCPVGTFITGFRTQVEPDQGGGDDTGLNRVEFQCENV